MAAAAGIDSVPFHDVNRNGSGGWMKALYPTSGDRGTVHEMCL